MGRKAKFPKPLFLSVTWGRATMSSKGLYLPPSTVTVTCVLRIGSFSVNGSFSLLPLRISVGCDMFCVESLKVIFKASFNKTLKLLFVLKIILELHFWKGMFSPLMELKAFPFLGSYHFHTKKSEVKKGNELYFTRRRRVTQVQELWWGHIFKGKYVRGAEVLCGDNVAPLFVSFCLEE